VTRAGCGRPLPEAYGGTIWAGVQLRSAVMDKLIEPTAMRQGASQRSEGSGEQTGTAAQVDDCCGLQFVGESAAKRMVTTTGGIAVVESHEVGVAVRVMRHAVRLTTVACNCFVHSTPATSCRTPGEPRVAEPFGCRTVSHRIGWRADHDCPAGKRRQGPCRSRRPLAQRTGELRSISQHDGSLFDRHRHGAGGHRALSPKCAVAAPCSIRVPPGDAARSATRTSAIEYRGALEGVRLTCSVITSTRAFQCEVAGRWHVWLRLARGTMNSAPRPRSRPTPPRVSRHRRLRRSAMPPEGMQGNCTLHATHVVRATNYGVTTRHIHRHVSQNGHAGTGCAPRIRSSRSNAVTSSCGGGSGGGHDQSAGSGDRSGFASTICRTRRYAALSSR